jgi:hypothetical protein
VNLVIHVEQYDVVGILPSQLESLALVCSAMGVDRRVFIDNTADGVLPEWGFIRYGSLEEWDEAENPQMVYAFTPPATGVDIREIDAPEADAWCAFGPSMGWRSPLPDDTFMWVSVPGGTMNARDVVPIALWEMSSWRAP